VPFGTSRHATGSPGGFAGVCGAVDSVIVHGMIHTSFFTYTRPSSRHLVITLHQHTPIIVIVATVAVAVAVCVVPHRSQFLQGGT
jgi:hypothetical protein